MAKKLENIYKKEKKTLHLKNADWILKRILSARHHVHVAAEALPD